MKVIQVGPKSVHVASFVKAISSHVKEQFHISEEKANFEGITKEFVLHFRGFNPFSIYQNYKKLEEIVKELKPQLIHIHQVNRMAFFVSRIGKKLNIPIVTTAWGSDVLLMPKKNVFFKWLVSSVLKNSAIVTGDSLHMISEMQSLVEDGLKYQCIQYGIDRVKPVDKEKIIYSNRFLNPLYRVPKIVDYFADFSENHTDWKLVIASVGEQKVELEEKVKQLNLSEKVEFVGWQENDENRNWYAKSSVYVSIPESDGTSVSVLEAISANCIPVLSNIPVSKEWVESGRNGIIESKEENPFEQVLNLNWDEAIEINTQQIEEKAIRESSIGKFHEIYLANGKK